VSTGAGALWLQFDTVDEDAAQAASAAGLDVVLDRCLMVEHRRLIA
jgi:predicted CoA-binding protein